MSHVTILQHPYLAENRIHAIIKNNDSMDPVLTERRIQMAELKKLPIGIEDFEKIRQEDFYMELHVIKRNARL